MKIALIQVSKSIILFNHSFVECGYNALYPDNLIQKFINGPITKVHAMDLPSIAAHWNIASKTKGDS